MTCKKFLAIILLSSMLSTDFHATHAPSLTPSAVNQAPAETIIYNPERARYPLTGGAMPSTKSEDCPFCKKLASGDDRTYLILARYKHMYVMLCEYPYLTGHLLILPLKHHASLTEFSQEERNECIALLSQSITIMQDYFKPEGLDIGINTGKAAGGSVPGHMHIHVLPRKMGDISFLGLIGKTTAIFTDMHKLYDDLKIKFEALTFEQIIPDLKTTLEKAPIA